MFSTRRRKTVMTAVALVASTALLTACQGTDGGSEDKKSEGSSSVHQDSQAKPGSEDGEQAQEGSGDAESEAGGEGPDGAQDGSGETETQAGGGESGGKGVSGTWFGNVSYLAPGKYTVSDMKGKEQAFFTSTTTDIQGAGEICGDADGQAAEPCTEAELEAAAKKGVSAKVEIKNGTAVSIVEDH